ncbi:MAG: bifunctional glutamate N-acetyltransferase/amino-acid acetyltransferase ArgJ [Gallicola sp.]|nr:bifunctional glutamate N-acetyltransferase/amino-acid acetyltransferase ArgJ [Gallicola sp.]
MKIKKIEGNVTAPLGFTAEGVCCSIREYNKKRKDLALILCENVSSAAGVYTKNKVQGAPIPVTKSHLEDGKAQAIIINSYIANTCTKDGLEVANEMCQITADAFDLKKEDVLVASTGVIGQSLPIDPIRKGVGMIKRTLSKEGGKNAAEAILTTDTYPKEVACQFEIQGKTITMGGIAKGSGMIHVNMGTMLAFITTDIGISPELIKKATEEVVKDTFNMVSVDGDTSTNDMLMILASGKAGNVEITEENEDYEAFLEAYRYCAKDLSKKIAGDGEGATKLLICSVTGAKTKQDARAAAKSVVSSSLLKAAIFGEDANWGRILCALGYSDAQMDIYGIDVYISSSAGDIMVCEKGYGLDFDEDLAKKILEEEEVRIKVQLQDGKESAEAYGCDLTYDYVKINGDYRS